jgi:23S rRNA pseudouridine2457 synthase
MMQRKGHHAPPTPAEEPARRPRRSEQRQGSGEAGALGRPGCISRVAGRQLVTRLLAAAGVSTPSRLPRLLAAGRVTVNGRTVRNTDARADPRRDVLAVDGEPVALTDVCRYLVVHKPYRVMCSFTDPEGRATLADYVPIPDVYAAGRLDYDSEGLVLLTNDGWLLHRITHPRYAHPKTYLVQVERIPTEEALEALRRGVVVKGEKTLPAEVELLRGAAAANVPPRSVPIRHRVNVPTAWLRLTLREGRKRQVRHMTAAVGYPTLRLIRVASGPIALGDLPPGAWRELTDEELDALARAFSPPRRKGARHTRAPAPSASRARKSRSRR